MSRASILRDLKNSPELIPSNAIKIIERARDIHQLWIDTKYKINCPMKQWDEYWVKAYNIVITELRKDLK